VFEIQIDAVGNVKAVRIIETTERLGSSLNECLRAALSEVWFAPEMVRTSVNRSPTWSSVLVQYPLAFRMH